MPATLVGVEVVDIVEHPEHIARVVENHDAGAADHRTGRSKGIGVKHEIHQVDLDRLLGAIGGLALHFVFLAGTQDFGRAAAGNNGFQFAAGFESAADIIDQLPDGDLTATQLKVTGILHVATDTEGTRATVAGGAELGELGRAHGDDVPDVAEGLDVVDDGRAVVEAEDGGEIRRFDARIRTFALERFEKARFFAADVGAGALMDINVAIEAAAADVFPDEAGGFRFFDRFFDNAGGLGEFAADVDVAEVHIERPGGDHHTLEQLVRILVQNVTIFEGARLRLVAVDHEVMRLAVFAFDEAPFDARGETGAAAAAQIRCFQFGHDLLGLHLERLFQRFVAAVALITFKGGIIVVASDILQNHALFRAVRGAQRLAVGAVGILQHSRGFGRLQLFDEPVIDQGNRRGAATGQTFDELDGVFAVRAVHPVTVVGRVHGPGSTEQFLADLVGSGHGTGQGAADAEGGFAGRGLAKPRVKSDQLEDIDRLEVEFARDPVDPAVVDVAEEILPQMEQRHRGAPLGNRVMRDGFVDTPEEVGRDLFGLAGRGGGHERGFVLQ